MSIASNISASGQAPQVKKQWVTPTIEVMQLDAAQNGGTHRVADATKPFRS